MKRLLIYLFLVFGLGLPVNADDHRVYMGFELQTVTKEIAKNLYLNKVEGAFVASVTKNSPAEKAGIKSNDVILYIDNKKVIDIENLLSLKDQKDPGSKLNLKIWRNEKLISKSITLSSLPYKNGYFEEKSPNQDAYPNVTEKAYYEKDCKKHGENIINYSKSKKSIFKGYNPECNTNIETVIHEGIIETYENSKLARTIVFKESLPEVEVNKIDIDIGAYSKHSNWYVKRNAKGNMLGIILKGDEIKSFNGKTLDDDQALFDFLNKKKAGDFIEIVVSRPKSDNLFKEKIQITKTVNRQFIGLTKGPESNYIFPFVINKLANQTTGTNRKISDGLLLLTSFNYSEKLLQDYNDLYQYYDEVSKTRNSNLPKKPIKKSYLAYLKDINEENANVITEKNPTIKTDEKYYALVIGNNNYEYLEKLDAAENDAEVIANVLQNKYGFEVELLLNGDYRTTVNSIFNMTDKLKENDNLLIYYAGHGELDKAENRGYWLPVDASKKSRAEWISNSRIVDRIKATKAKHVLLIADSCFSGTLMRSGITPEANEAIDEKYIERLKKKKTRLVVTSGGNEPVVDSDGGQHSLFALKLIDILRNNKSVINSSTLFEPIRQYVSDNADQTPERAMIHKTGHDGGDFLFFPKN